MATVTLAFAKQKIAEFFAENLEFEKQEGGLMLSASGEMTFQDTPSLETLINEKPSCHVTIEKDGQEVFAQEMHVSVFQFEPTQIAVLLS